MAAKKQRNINTLTDTELEVLFHDWTAGDLNAIEIAAKHRIARSSLQTLAKRNEWGPPGRIDPPGRTPLYDPSYDNQAYVACNNAGFTRKSLAALFYVSETTIYTWMKKHPSFSEAIRRGSDEFNCKVAEESLVKLVKGFAYNEVTKERVAVLEDYEEIDEVTGEVIKKQRHAGYKLAPVKSVRKYIAPNERAIMNLLCNRDPARWKSINKIEVSGPDGGKIQHDHSTDTILAAAMGLVSDKGPKLTDLVQQQGGAGE